MHYEYYQKTKGGLYTVNRPVDQLEVVYSSRKDSTGKPRKDIPAGYNLLVAVQRGGYSKTIFRRRD